MGQILQGNSACSEASQMIVFYTQCPSQLAPFTPLETAQIIVWKALEEAVKGFLLKDKYSRTN